MNTNEVCKAFALLIKLFVSGSTCDFPTLNSDVIAVPTKAAYQIGESLSLSCPGGSQLEGEVSEVMCNPSLQWSPSPAGAQCKAGAAQFIPKVKRSQIFPVNGMLFCCCGNQHVMSFLRQREIHMYGSFYYLRANSFCSSRHPEV